MDQIKSLVLAHPPAAHARLFDRPGAKSSLDPLGLCLACSHPDSAPAAAVATVPGRDLCARP